MIVTKKELKVLESIDLSKKQERVIERVVIKLGLSILLFFSLMTSSIGLLGYYIGINSELVIPKHLMNWFWVPVMIPLFLVMWAVHKVFD